MAEKINKSSENDPQTVSDKYVVKRTILSFVGLGLFFVGAYFAWMWLYHHQPEAGKKDSVQEPLRKVMNANDRLFNETFAETRLSKTYPKSAAVKKVRVNGAVGLTSKFDPSTWKLKVVRSPGDTLFVTMDDIKAMPKTHLTFDFKCIEGWSQITNWSGVPLSYFIKYYHLDKQAQLSYIGLKTPDQQYYVGIDMQSALHPQTLLCYEMNGKPLPLNQGFPLRLIIPVKYGVKNLKRIGTLYFSEKRPPDYWAERGYDYFAGL